MQVKVPRTELLIDFNARTFTAYIAESKQKFMSNHIRGAQDHDYVRVEIAKTPSGKFWTPNCEEEIIWTDASFKIGHIIGMIKMPNPKVSVDYGEFS